MLDRLSPMRGVRLVVDTDDLDVVACCINGLFHLQHLQVLHLFRCCLPRFEPAVVSSQVCVGYDTDVNLDNLLECLAEAGLMPFAGLDLVMPRIVEFVAPDATVRELKNRLLSSAYFPEGACFEQRVLDVPPFPAHLPLMRAGRSLVKPVYLLTSSVVKPY